MTIWTDSGFRITYIWINLFILSTILVFHSYRLCYLQRDRKGSSIRIFKYISFEHLSFIVIIAAIFPAVQQAIIYTPKMVLSHAICAFTTTFGIVFLALSKLALHLFVTMRSQVSRNDHITSIWYKIGLTLILSDVLYITYVLSGIPTIESMQHGVLCKVTQISLPVYIWFAMNDFIIGCYCLLAFIVPLRKYVLLEEDTNEKAVTVSNQNEMKKEAMQLRSLVQRIIAYSSIALISTIIFTVTSSIVNESGGVLFALDSTINSFCVTFQFAISGWQQCSFSFCFRNGVAKTLKSLSSLSSLSITSPASSDPNAVATEITIKSTNNDVRMIIHSEMHSSTVDIDNTQKPNPKPNPKPSPKTSPKQKHVPKPKLNKVPSLINNVSLSQSLVENENLTDLI